MTDALKLHDDALVIDGLVYHCDGDVTDLKFATLRPTLQRPAPRSRAGTES